MKKCEKCGKEGTVTQTIKFKKKGRLGSVKHFTNLCDSCTTKRMEALLEAVVKSLK